MSSRRGLCAGAEGPGRKMGIGIAFATRDAATRSSAHQTKALSGRAQVHEAAHVSELWRDLLVDMVVVQMQMRDLEEAAQLGRNVRDGVIVDVQGLEVGVAPEPALGRQVADLARDGAREAVVAKVEDCEVR